MVYIDVNIYNHKRSKPGKSTKRLYNPTEVAEQDRQTDRYRCSFLSLTFPVQAY